MRAVQTIESTKAKTRFATLAGQAAAADVAITRHGRIEAYVLSPERYAHLAAVDRVGTDVLAKLDADFDAMVARMQTTAHTRAVDRIATAALATILGSAPPVKSTRGSRLHKRTG